MSIVSHDHALTERLERVDKEHLVFLAAMYFDAWHGGELQLDDDASLEVLDNILEAAPSWPRLLREWHHRAEQITNIELSKARAGHTEPRTGSILR